MVICNRCKKQVRKFEKWNGEYFCNNCCYEIEELEKDKQNVCDSTRSVYPLLADVRAVLDDLLEDAVYLYQYYPNNYRKKDKEYFKKAFELQEKLKELS